LADEPRTPSETPATRYRLTRFVFLRLLGLVYVVAFLCLCNQVLPLLGHDGLLPVSRYLGDYESSGLSRPSLFLRLPTLFWWGRSDGLLTALS
jgi:hypothetical protein